MVKQYPHIATATETKPATRDEGSGTWTKGQTFETKFECRAEPNGSGKFLSNVDGSRIDYSYMVYFPKSVLLKVGVKLSISDKENQVFVGDVKRFHQGQLNSRVWV